MLRFRLHDLSRSRFAYHVNQFDVGQSRRCSHIFSILDAACFQPQLVELRRLFSEGRRTKNGVKRTRTLPSRTMFSRFLSFWRNLLSMGPLLFAIRSLYNWGTGRLVPPDDPEGKELIGFSKTKLKV